MCIRDRWNVLPAKGALTAFETHYTNYAKKYLQQIGGKQGNYPLLAKIEQRRADIQEIMAIEKN